MATAKAPARRIRTFPGFQLRFPITDVQFVGRQSFCRLMTPWLCLMPGTHRPGQYGLKNLLVIVDWKSKRRAKLLADNSHSEREEALRIAVSADLNPEPRSVCSWGLRVLILRWHRQF